MLRRVPATDWAKAKQDTDYVMGLTSVGFGMSMLAGDDIWKALPWYFRWPAKLFLRKQVKAAQEQQKQLRDQLAGEGAGLPADGSVLDLHKSWQALHWLLCESPWEGPEPLRSAILGGEETGEDLGYGPARLVEPAMVQDVAKALAMLSAAQIMKRYDGEKMEALEIYPGGFEDDEDWKEDIERDFERLQQFYTAAAKNGEGVVSWIS